MRPSESNEALRVVIMCYSLGRGGAERMTVELARAWADRGCEVTVFTLAPPEVDFFVLDPRVHHIHVPNPIKPNDSLITSLSVNLRRIFAIRRLLVSTRAHVALGMMSASAVLLAFAGFGLPTRTYGSERTYPPMAPLRPGKGPLRSVAYGLLDAVICQTETAARWVRRNTFAQRTVVIPNHVVFPLPSQSPNVPIRNVVAADRPFALAVGRMSEEKQFSKLISAFAALAAEYPNWDLVIAGDGPDRESLESQIRAANLHTRVHVPGAVGNIGDWYNQAEIFAMTSRFEGFPNALLEAMAHGVASVAFDCPTGPAEIIINGENGILVALDDEPSFIESLRRLMKDSAYRHRLGASAVKVQQRFDRDRIMDSWAQALGLASTD